MQPGNQPISPLSAPQVVPLLQALNQAEELVAAMAMRLDPITNHATSITSKDSPPLSSVTGRLTALGDTLQYLLDNIEL